MRSAKTAELVVPAIWQREWAAPLRNRALSFCKSVFGIHKKRHTESGMYGFHRRSLLSFRPNGFLTPFCTHIWSHRVLKHIISGERGWEALWLALWPLRAQAIAFLGAVGAYYFEGRNGLGLGRAPLLGYSLDKF